MSVALTVVGSINQDLVAFADRAPRPGETVLGGSLVRLPGGKGANQAMAARRLGATVRIVGAVGVDGEGVALAAGMAEAGINTDDVQILEGATGVALIVVDGAGENSIVVCAGVNNEVDIDRIALAPEEAVLAQLEVPMAVIEAVAERTRGFFALNVSPAQPIPDSLVQRVDLAIVNETELEAMPQLRDSRLLALTLGGDGAVLYREGQEVARARVRAERVVNSVGAGDAFAAALTLGILQGDGDAAALQRACAVGAAAVADENSQPQLKPLHAYDTEVSS